MTGRKKIKTEMMKETLGRSRSMLSLLQAAREGRNGGSGSDKVGSKISGVIAKSRRGESSSDSKNALKQNSGGRTLQVQGQG